MRTVVVSIWSPFQPRALLYSDAFDILRRQCHLVILSPAYQDEYFQREFAGAGVTLDAFNHEEQRLEALVARVRRFVLSSERRNSTINLFSLGLRRQHYRLYLLLQALNKVFARSAFLRRHWLAVERRLVRDVKCEWIFRKYSPDLIIAGSYGVFTPDIKLIRAARRHRVRTMGYVHGWDNLTSKGIIGARPDVLLIWGEQMRREAVEYHDVPEDALRMVGAPQFDAYARPESFRGREEFFRDLGLDPDRKTILYGTISPQYFPHNHEVVAMLAEAIRSGKVGSRSQLIVRPHPQTCVNDSWSEDMNFYVELRRRYPFVAVEIPRIHFGKHMWLPERRDSTVLGEMLYHSEVCVHPGSTLTIDACVMDRPVVCVAFDGRAEKPYEDSIRRWYDFSYYEPVLRAGAVRIASTLDELVSSVNAYLESPARDRSNRASVVGEHLVKADGKAGERLAQSVLDELRTVA